MAGAANRGFGGSEQHRGPETSRITSPTTSSTGSRPEESSAAGVVGAVKDKAQELASDLSRKAEGAWESARHGAQDLASTFSTSAEDAWGAVTSCMSRYPFATFLAGLGVGFLVARALEPSFLPDFRRGGSRHYPGNEGL